ncbi:MAG: hypothetical protein RSD95_10780 [Clostridia bacterium]
MARERPIKSLDELMDGALTERFNYEMERVLNNVFDPNTNAKAKRQIQIVIGIAPNERRDAAEFKVDVKSKVAPPSAVTQTVFLSISDDGIVTATEMTNQVRGQINMDGETSIPRVIEFKRADSK